MYGDGSEGLVVPMLLRVVHLDLRDFAVDRRVEIYFFFAVSSALKTWDLSILKMFIRTGSFEPPHLL